eukprot:3932505-Rhodomonas_salina.1
MELVDADATSEAQSEPMDLVSDPARSSLDDAVNLGWGRVGNKNNPAVGAAAQRRSGLQQAMEQGWGKPRHGNVVPNLKFKAMESPSSVLTMQGLAPAAVRRHDLAATARQSRHNVLASTDAAQPTVTDFSARRVDSDGRNDPRMHWRNRPPSDSHDP